MFDFKTVLGEVDGIPEYKQILEKINKDEEIPNDLWESWEKSGLKESYNVFYNLFKTGQDSKIPENILEYLIDNKDELADLVYNLTLDNVNVSRLEELFNKESKIQEKLEKIKNSEKSKSDGPSLEKALDMAPESNVYDARVKNIIENKINEISLRDSNDRMQAHNKNVNTVDNLTDSIESKNNHLYRQKSEMNNINSRIIDRLFHKYDGISAIESIKDYYNTEIDILKESIDEKNIDPNLIDEGVDLNDKSYDDEINKEIKKYENILNVLDSIKDLSSMEATEKLYKNFLLIPNDTEIPHLSGLKKEFKSMRDYFNMCSDLEKEIENLKIELKNKIQENSSKDKLLTSRDIEQKVYEYRKHIENKYKNFPEETINELENSYRTILKNENKKVQKSIKVDITGKDLEDVLDSIFRLKNKNLTLKQLRAIYNELKSHNINIEFNDLKKYIDNRNIFEGPVLK